MSILPAPRPRTGLWLVLTVLLSVGVFAPTLLNGFTFDDPHYARRHTPTGDANPMVAELRPFAEYWGKPMNWGLPTPCRGFRPVTVYSYALVNAGFASGTGDDAAFAHHLLNLLLHGAATALAFLLVLPFAGSSGALLGALVFGVHALHSEAVAAIVGRAELLTFVFGATATLAYAAALTRSGWPRAIGLALAAVSLMLSLGGKESAVAWVAFAPLFAWLRDDRRREQILPGALALGLPLLAYLLLRTAMLAAHVEPRGGFAVEYDANPLYYLPLLDRVLSATVVLAVGLAKVVVPFHLSSTYGDGPFAVVTTPLHLGFLAASFALVAPLVLACRAPTRHPLPFLAAASFFGFTFVTSNIPCPIETIFGERLFYAAVLAPAFAAAWLRQHAGGRLVPFAVGALVVWLGWNCLLSVHRSLVWYDRMSLTTDDLRSQPHSVGLHVDMGNLHLWNFDPASARVEFAAALRTNPGSPRALRFAAEHAPDDEAMALLERALASPHLVPATEGRRVHWAIGNLHEKAGRHAEARRAFLTALACNPHVQDIRLHLLRDTVQKGEFEEFARLLDEGLRLDPDNRWFAMYRGMLHHARGEWRAAADALRGSLDGLPLQLQAVEAWLRLADAFLHLGEFDAARAIAQRFLAMRQQPPHVRSACTELVARTAAATAPR